MTDAELVGHIARLPHRRGNFKQVIRELGAKGAQREEVETALARLAARGDLIALRNGHYAPKALREAIRATGPTVRRDLGKQAEGLAPIAAAHAPTEKSHVSL